MTTPLTVRTDRRDDSTVVVIADGEIDLSNVEMFGAAVTEAVQSGAAVTVDLRAVQYLDSSAINALFAYAEQLHLIANPVLMPVLTVSGLTELAIVESALASETPLKRTGSRHARREFRAPSRGT